MTPHQIRLAVAGAFVLSTALKSRYTARIGKHRLEKVTKENNAHKELAKLLLDERESFEGILETAHTRINYLITLLEKHDVPVDEFDLIVINDLTQ